MKFSEKEIQEYIWGHKDEFMELVEEPDRHVSSIFANDLSDLNAQALIRDRLYRKLQDGFDKLQSLLLIGIEVRLEQKSNSTIRADFIGTFPGDTGIAIVELKKSSQTERQAFTELLAYANHLANCFPGFTREAAVYVLISPMNTRIARDAVIHSLTFDNRTIIPLVPYFNDESDLSTLRLKLWSPVESELTDFSG